MVSKVLSPSSDGFQKVPSVGILHRRFKPSPFVEVVQDQFGRDIRHTNLQPASKLPVINQDNSMVSAVPTMRHEMVLAICRLINVIRNQDDALRFFNNQLLD